MPQGHETLSHPVVVHSILWPNFIVSLKHQVKYPGNVPPKRAINEQQRHHLKSLLVNYSVKNKKKKTSVYQLNCINLYHMMVE